MNSIKVYQVGERFFEGIPFYAERRTEVVEDTGEIVYPSVSLLPYSEVKELKNCTQLWRGKLFDGSESQFFKFLISTKTGDNFKEYILCFSR